MQTPPSESGPRRPRVGHIQFLNCLPLYWGLVHSGDLLDIDLTRDTPDRLGDMLVRGDLDIGPISSVEYLRHSEQLLLLPGLAVGSDGPVLSVNCVSQVPLEELDGRQVALGSTSRTSVLLARLYLEDCVRVRPRYVTSAPDLPAMLRESAAAVLIGDVALRAAFEAPARGLHVQDLGQAWNQWTGLPMVFAVWAVRSDYAAARPDLAAAVHDAFLRSRDLALESVDEVAALAARWDVLDGPSLATYFRGLDFSLGSRQLAGLREFARRAAAREAVPATAELRFLPR